MSRLDDRDGFREIQADEWQARKLWGARPSDLHWKLLQYGAEPDTWVLAGEIFCTGCGDPRRVEVQTRLLPYHWQGANLDEPGDLVTLRGLHLTPALLLVRCPQCRAKYTLVSYIGPDGPDVILLPAQRGRAGTPNTPKAVGYYLDQAERAKSAGARSAALAMYRAGIEAILHEQGFKTGTMSDKISALRAEKRSDAPRAWVADVDDVAIEMLKRLADGALHLDDGDIADQAAIDADLLASVELVVGALTFSIYETEAAHRQAKKKMQAALRQLKGRGPEAVA